VSPAEPGPAAGQALAAARRDLAAELAQGLPCRADRETMLAALRDIARLAGRWRMGINDVGPAAAAEVMDAIRGEAVTRADLQAGLAAEQCGADALPADFTRLGDEDLPFRSGGVRPGE
jgi:hypothetical protein